MAVTFRSRSSKSNHQEQRSRGNQRGSVCGYVVKTLIQWIAVLSMQELKGIPTRTKYESIVYETKYAEET